jgi:RES domain-containing protein
MRVWRLCSRRHHVPDGEGARLSGGRWNLPGTAVIYTSASLSLAVLEILVHVDSDLLPPDLVILSADIPDRLKIDSLNENQLPPNWTVYPAPEATQALGTEWVRRAQTAVLSVPSVVIRHERNFLLNPAHGEYGKIVWSKPSPFTWDPRLAKQ